MKIEYQVKRHTLQFFIVVLLYVMNMCCVIKAYAQSPHPQRIGEGYRDVAFFKDAFFAVGTNGKITKISTSGDCKAANSTVDITLNCVYAFQNVLVVGGDDGTILYSTDGEQFTLVESGIAAAIYEMTSLNDVLIAGSENGLVLGSTDGQLWQVLYTRARGNILSLTHNNSSFFGITDAGEIMKSADGITWATTDYNETYAGFNPPCRFTSISAASNRIIIIGSHDDNSPCILFSSLGHVWTERMPVYKDEKEQLCNLTGFLYDVAYDAVHEQFVVACSGGSLFTLPNCHKCNELLNISKHDLYAVVMTTQAVCTVGAGYFVFTQDY